MKIITKQEQDRCQQFSTHRLSQDHSQRRTNISRQEPVPISHGTFGSHQTQGPKQTSEYSKLTSKHNWSPPTYGFAS